MKRFYIVFIKLIVTILPIVILDSQTVIFAEHARGQAENNVTFQWAFGAIRNSKLGPQFEAITRDTVMKSGDQIKFFLRIENKCFVYLIYHSSQGDISLLFPYRFKLWDTDCRISRNYYVPKDDQWYKLDEYTGTEKLYLLASADRLAEFEDLISEYESADKSNKIAIGKEIVVEIHKLRKKYRKFKSHVEKPVTIIGKIRGTVKTKAADLKDIADYAIEISAKSFFIRSFTIEHK